MEQELSIPVNHDDFIHDIAYNFYGTRLATCGSDRTIKIWDWNRQTGLWILNESITGHDSSVVRLSWAHPEFGQVLASCSLDRTVRIWVEQESSPKNSGHRWRVSTPLTSSDAAVHSIAFAPEYTSLTIAAGSSDGKVRLYAPTEAIKLTNWTVNYSIDFVPGEATDSDGPLCVSWCKSRFAAARMIVVGGSRHNRVKVFQLHSSGFAELLELAQYDSPVLDIDWAPSMGRSYHLIATGCADGHIRIYKFWSESGLEKAHMADSLFAHEGDESDVSDSGGAHGEADGDSSSEDDSDDSDEDSDESATDDDEDGDEGDGSEDTDGDRGSGGGWTDGMYNDGGQGRRSRGRGKGRGSSRATGPRAELAGDLAVQPSVPIRRVRWNSTGTLLVSSSDDGVVRMWRMTVNGTWREIAAVSAEKDA